MVPLAPIVTRKQKIVFLQLDINNIYALVTEKEKSEIKLTGLTV